jgi:hypothetical protein
MAERIDYYMDANERETIHRGLRIALAYVMLAIVKEDIIYDKDRLAPLERLEIDLKDVLGQFD